jgi:secreted trypsin-like serine protease
MQKRGHVLWASTLVVWTALLVYGMFKFYPIYRARNIPEREAQLMNLKKPQFLNLHEYSPADAQVVGLLKQSQDISAFLGSELTPEDRRQATALLATTNRQAALAASKRNLGFVWNGNDPATLGQFPYQVGIVLNNFVPYAARGFQCSGVLVTNAWVLTAGHCLDDNSQPADIEVYFGHLKLSESDQPNCNCWSIVAEIKRYPNYKVIGTQYGQIIEGDAALLRIDPPLSAGPNVAPIPIVESTSAASIVKPGLATIAGWGKSTTTVNSLSDALLYGTVKVTPDATCINSFSKGTIMPDMLCANPYPSSACQGDSGGPLLMRGQSADGHTMTDYVAGLVSWGYPLGACPPMKPTIYSRVSAFSDWIDKCLKGQDCPSSIPGS